MARDHIAARRFKLLGAPNREVTAYIWSPEVESNGAYKCDYRIVGLGDEKARSVYGADSMQALLLTLAAIGGDLYLSSEYKEGKLEWETVRKGDLGLPVSDVISHIPPVGSVF